MQKPIIVPLSGHFDRAFGYRRSVCIVKRLRHRFNLTMKSFCRLVSGPARSDLCPLWRHGSVSAKASTGSFHRLDTDCDLHRLGLESHPFTIVRRPSFRPYPPLPG